MPTTRSIILDVEERRQGNALAAAGKDMRQLADETDRTDDKFKLFQQDTKRVNEELEKSTQKVKDLRQQFARTGDSGLLSDIRKEETRARNLQNVLKGLRQDAEKEGTVIGATFTNSFLKQVGSLGEGGFGGAGIPALIAGVGTLLAVSAAPLGAMIAGAVTGAVGTGGIIGGVLAASHDQRVKDAFTGLVDVAKQTFFDAGFQFVGPVLGAVGMIQKELQSFNLAKTFSAFAPDLTIITRGLIDFLNALKPGLDALAGRSRFFAEGAAEGFKMLGKALGEFLTEVSSSPGTLEGLKALFVVLAGTIQFLGAVLDALSRSFHAFNVMSEGFFQGTQKFLALGHVHVGVVDDIVTGLGNLVGRNDDAMKSTIALGYVFSGTAADAQKVADALQRENDELQNTIDLIQKALGIVMSLDEANLRITGDIRKFTESIAQNGKAWNDNTDAGQQQREMLLGLLNDAERVREAQIAAGVSVQQANAQYDAQVQALLKLAGQAGATKQQLDALAKTYEIKFSIDAITNVVSNVAGAIGNVFRGLTFGGNNAEKSSTFGGGRAAGGPVQSGMSYLVGEHGPEMLYMGSNGYVDSKQGGGTTQLVVSATDGAAAALLQMLRFEIRSQGGQLSVLGLKA